MINKKSMSELVAILGLLSVGVLAVITFQTWVVDVVSQKEATLEEERLSTPVEIGELSGNFLYIRTDSQKEVKRLSLEGVDCHGEFNLVEGVNSIDVSQCLDEVDEAIFEVLIVTSDEVQTKSISKDLPLQSLVLPGEIFISVWNTSVDAMTPNNQIALPLLEEGEYDFIVEGTNLQESPVHITSYEDNILTFSEEGVYQLNMTGDISGWSFHPEYQKRMELTELNESDSLKLKEIKRWGSLHLGNSAGYFTNTNNLKISANDRLNLSGTTNFTGMFRDSGISGGIYRWNVSEVVDMTDLFRRAENFNEDIGDWNVSNVKSMSGMFSYSFSFNQDLNEWDVSNVEDMSYMFSRANFNNPLDKWNTSAVTDMMETFRNTKSFNQPLDWDTSSVTNMRGTFRDAESFNQPLDWDTSSVTDMRRTFRDAENFNQPLDWDTSSVTNMRSMFQSANSFNQSLIMWNVSNVEDCSEFDRNTHQWTEPKPDLDSECLN